MRWAGTSGVDDVRGLAVALDPRLIGVSHTKAFARPLIFVDTKNPIPFADSHPCAGCSNTE